MKVLVSLLLLLFSQAALCQDKSELDIKATFCISLGDNADSTIGSPADGEEVPNNKGGLYWIECPGSSFLGLEYAMLAAFIENGKTTLLRVYLNSKKDAQTVTKHAGRYTNCSIKVQFKRGHYYADITKR